jgi:purine-binding chemotaxis protein CheW
MGTTTLEQALVLRSAEVEKVVEVDEPELKLVIFLLGEDRFALRGEYVREILADTPVFFVPGCPPRIEGVIHLRGKVEAVLRIHEMLGLRPTQACGGTALLLVEADGVRAAIRVDGVLDVCDVTQSAIEAPPGTLADALQGVVDGIVRRSDTAALLLDPGALLARQGSASASG